MLNMNTQPNRMRREGTVSASPSPTPEDSSLALSVADSQRTGRKTTSTQASGSMRTGRWTFEEKLLFLYGLRKYGKGRWKKISVYLPNRWVLKNEKHANGGIRKTSITHQPNFLDLASHFGDFRSLVQIKSHAQKVIKRYDNGEDVFLRLDENIVRTEAVVEQIHDQMKNEGIPIPPAQGGITRERKVKMVDVREQIVAASALCQLSQPTPSPLPTTQHSFQTTSTAAANTVTTSLPTNPAQIRNIVLGSSAHVVKL